MSSDTAVLSPTTSADYCIDPADLNVPEPTLPPQATKRISVLPAIDLSNGTIGFAVPRGWEDHFHPEPWLIEDALRQAIRPAQWNPYLEILTITVASHENRTGEPVHFSLIPLLQAQEG